MPNRLFGFGVCATPPSMLLGGGSAPELARAARTAPSEDGLRCETSSRTAVATALRCSAPALATTSAAFAGSSGGGTLRSDLMASFVSNVGAAKAPGAAGHAARNAVAINAFSFILLLVCERSRQRSGSLEVFVNSRSCANNFFVFLSPADATSVQGAWMAANPSARPYSASVRAISGNAPRFE
jgi:hypothetical protein